MKYVDIITAQKVEISYALAELRERIVAALIDYLIVSAYSIIVFIVFLLILRNNESALDIVAYLFILPVVLLYSLVCEIVMDGQTFGKRVMKVRVMKLDGGQPALFDYAIRWALRPVDVLMSGGAIAMILIKASPQGQRIGDALAGTVVVKSNFNEGLTLAKVMSRHNIADYKVTYPQAVRFNERQMLVVQETLRRSQEHNNPAHWECMEELAGKLRMRMDVPYKGEPDDIFLKTVLRDYIFLSK